MDNSNTATTSIILFIGSAVMCIHLRQDDDNDNNNNNSGDDLSLLSSFPRNFSWGGRPAPESEEANKVATFGTTGR
jgi:hypothetical protein